jgi:hypothetical protein
VGNNSEGFSDCPLLSGWYHDKFPGLARILILQLQTPQALRSYFVHGTVSYISLQQEKYSPPGSTPVHEHNENIRRLSFCREPRVNKPSMASNHNWIVGLNRLFLVCLTPAYISVLLSNQHYVGVGLPGKRHRRYETGRTFLVPAKSEIEMHPAPSPPETCISATLDSSQFVAIPIVPACFLGKAGRSCSLLFRAGGAV